MTTRTCATCLDVPAPAIDGVRAGLLGVLAAQVERRLDDLTGGEVDMLADVYAEGASRHPTLRASPCPVVVRRPCVCGHDFAEHDYAEVCGCAGRRYGGHDHTGECLSCGCPRWRPQPCPVETTLSTQAACLDVCTCGGEHHAGAAYYVSARRGDDTALLLGPYATHSMALSMVGTGRRLAEKVDARAFWYAFGTLAIRSGEAPPGKLNDLLAVPEPEPEPAPRRARKARS